jgi:RHS repeat-associated protein
LARKVLPRGNEASFLWDTENPDWKCRNNLLMKILKTIPGGTEANITERWTYEPRFQFVKTYSSPRELEDGDSNDGDFTTEYFYDYEEGLNSIDYNGDGYTSMEFGNIVKIKLPTLSGYSPPKQSEIFYFHSADGKFSKVKGQLGTTTEIELGDWDYPIARISDKDGNACKTQLTYNWFGKLTKVIDPEWENWDPSGGQAPSWKCQYDEWNNPTLATAPAPHNTRVFYSYCLRGNLTRVDIENLDKDNQVVSGNPWFTSKISYDLDRNPTRFTHELSSSVALCTQYEYDGLGRWVSRISPGGKVSRQGFNERGFLISEVEAYGTPDQAETSYSHDLNGNIVSVTNPRGYTEIYSYDGFDRNVEVRNPQGGIRKTSYDLAGNKIATSLHLMPESPATSELINVFDEHNLRIEERRRFIEADSTDRGWVVRKWEYDERGNVTKAIDQLGNATYFYYDALGRLARIVDSCSNESAVDYNKNGLVQMLFSKETNQLNGTTEEYTYEFTYDVLGRRISSIWYNCDNSSIRTETRRSYDSRGNVVFAERIDGKATETEYDGLSRAIKTAKQIKAGSILEGDISVKTIYDEDGNIISRIDHDGNCTLFRYNARNELIEIVKPHGTIATIERDLNGNVVSRIDPNGNVITSIYDNMDRLTARFAQLGASVIGPTSEVFVWDSLGRLLTSSNGNHSCERRYNSLSVVEKEINGLNEEEDLEMNWKYDDKLNVIQFISPSSVKIGRLFDAIGRISEFEVNDSHVATFMYAGNGNLLAACSIGNGQALSIALDGYGDERRRDWGSSILDLTSIYNSDRLLKKVVHNHAEGAYTEVEMDSASRITCAKTNVDPTSLIAEVEERISLNSGNTRISSVRIDESGCISTEYVSNENGQYTRIAGDVLSYDSNGNLIGDSKYCYFYSFKNQLVMVKQVSDNKVIGEYEYDTIGRRVLRTFWDDEKGRYESRRYVYDGWRLIEQYRDVGNGFSIFATYAFGQELDHIVSMSIRDINDVDEDEDITEMVTYYFHQDQMFNVHCLTDSIGRVVERYEYTPFGEMRLFISAGDDGSWYTDDDVCDISGRSRIYNSMHFKGRELDQETGFYYFRYRNYSASHGMFIQVDPLEFSQFIRNNGNSYAFPYCNPFSISDPFGTGPTSVVVSPVAPSIDPDSMEGDPNAVYVPTWARYNNPKAVKVYSDRGRVKRAEERSRNEISSRSIVRVIAIDSNPTPTKVLGVDAGKCWPALALRLARFQTRHSANIRTVVVSAKSLPAAWEAISNAVPAGSKLYEIQLWAHGTKGLIWWGGKSYSFEVFLRKNRTPALSRIIKLMEGGNCVKFRCCEYFLGKGGEKAAETAANCFKIKVWGTEGYDYGIITFYGRELLPGQRAGDTWPVGPERLEDRWYGFLRFGDLVAALGR